MKHLPGDFSRDIPEFTDEELEDRCDEADRRQKEKRTLWNTYHEFKIDLNGKTLLTNCLPSPPTINDFYDIDPQNDPQINALNYFKSFNPKQMERIGIVIIRVKHPGGTYYAAELHGTIEAANIAAEAEGIKMRILPI